MLHIAHITHSHNLGGLPVLGLANLASLLSDYEQDRFSAAPIERTQQKAAHWITPGTVRLPRQLDPYIVSLLANTLPLLEQKGHWQHSFPSNVFSAFAGMTIAIKKSRAFPEIFALTLESLRAGAITHRELAQHCDVERITEAHQLTLTFVESPSGRYRLQLEPILKKLHQALGIVGVPAAMLAASLAEQRGGAGTFPLYQTADWILTLELDCGTVNQNRFRKLWQKWSRQTPCRAEGGTLYIAHATQAPALKICLTPRDGVGFILPEQCQEVEDLSKQLKKNLKVLQRRTIPEASELFYASW